MEYVPKLFYRASKGGRRWRYAVCKFSRHEFTSFASKTILLCGEKVSQDVHRCYFHVWTISLYNEFDIFNFYNCISALKLGKLGWETVQISYSKCYNVTLCYRKELRAYVPAWFSSLRYLLLRWIIMIVDIVATCSMLQDKYRISLFFDSWYKRIRIWF